MGIENKTKLPAIYQAAIEGKGPLAEIKKAYDRYLDIREQYYKGIEKEEALKNAWLDYMQTTDMYKGWNE